MKFLRFLYVAIPATLAVCAAFGFLLWVLGASAMSGTPLAHAWTVGFWAMLLYAGTYQMLIIGVLICRIARWPLAPLLHQLIWATTIAFVAAMVYVAVQLGWLAP